MRPDLTTSGPLPESLTFRLSAIEGIEPVLFSTASDDALLFLTPVLGPSAVLLLHRISTWLVPGDVEHVTISPGHLGQYIGINAAQVAKTLDRLCRFNFAYDLGSGDYTILPCVRRYHARWLETLPIAVRDALIDWQRQVVHTAPNPVASLIAAFEDYDRAKPWE
jgi:hypothetical protein